MPEPAVNPSPIRVLVVDDHALFRRGVVELLREEPGLDVVGEAGNAQEALVLTRRHAPQVVLLDVHMPGARGVEILPALKREGAGRVIMLTISDRDEDLMAALAGGADGYLLKNTEPEELVRAIHRVVAGHGALAPEVTPRVMQAAAQRPPEPSPAGILSPREQEVLHALAQGATTGEIARQLVISESTVKTHVRHILEKLDATTRAEAVARAAALGLLSSSSSSSS